MWLPYTIAAVAVADDTYVPSKMGLLTVEVRPTAVEEKIRNYEASAAALVVNGNIQVVVVDAVDDDDAVGLTERQLDLGTYFHNFVPYSSQYLKDHRLIQPY